MDTDRATQNHNDGEKDAAEGSGYNLPWNTFDETSTGPNGPQRREDNKHYREGWANGQKQK